jgi:alpha-maltose-1-phosphate synthase
LFQIPIVGVIQYISEPIERWWGQTPDAAIVEQEAILFRQAEMLICASHSLRTIIQDSYGVHTDRLQVVHNGMNVQAFTQSPFTVEQIANLRRTVAKSGEKIVLFAGRLHPQKGIAALVAAAARVIADYPQVRYLLAGAPDSQRFTQVIQDLLDQHADAQPKIKLLGKIPRKQLAWLYQVADVAVVPSVYEPFGYAAIEAMAAGVPVVATEVGGLAEIIEQGRSGLLIPVHARTTGPHTVDVERLADAQIALLTDAALAQRLGAAGRQRVVAEFNIDKMTRAIIDVYERAIAKS